MSSSDDNADKFKDAHGADDHLSDQDIAKALADFEEEFKDFDTSGADTANNADGATSADDADDAQNGAHGDAHSTDDDDLDTLKQLDPFESELEGLLGNKAKAAVLITPLQQPELLSAFCVLSDISASCIGTQQGAVALLKNLDGASPEAAAKDLTTVIAGLSVVLAINRADKLEAKLWIDGKPGSDFAPPLLFMQVADFVEDFMIGSTDLNGLRVNGLTILDSGSMSRGEALKVIASHTKFRPGQSGTGVVE